MMYLMLALGVIGSLVGINANENNVELVEIEIENIYRIIELKVQKIKRMININIDIMGKKKHLLLDPLIRNEMYISSIEYISPMNNHINRMNKVIIDNVYRNYSIVMGFNTNSITEYIDDLICFDNLKVYFVGNNGDNIILNNNNKELLRIHEKYMENKENGNFTVSKIFSRNYINFKRIRINNDVSFYVLMIHYRFYFNFSSYSHVWIIIFSILVLGCITFFSTFIFTYPLTNLVKEMEKVSRLDLSSYKSSNILQLKEYDIIEEHLKEIKYCLGNHKSYLPKHVLCEIYSKEKIIGIDVKNIDISILFVNIVQFVQFCEYLAPTELVEFLELFFSKIFEIVKRNHGLIDKFMGGGLLCLYNSSEDTQQLHEYYAAKTAVDMNIEIRKKVFRKYDLVVHCGINSDVALVGYIGCDNHIQFTALGTAVNIASRYEHLNSRFDTEILVGEKTFWGIKHQLFCKWIGKYRIRGIKESKDIWEVKINQDNDGEQYECEMFDLLKTSLDKEDYLKARNIFNRIASRHDNDAIIKGIENQFFN